jgi:hypothetical protein
MTGFNMLLQDFSPSRYLKGEGMGRISRRGVGVSVMEMKDVN